VAIIDGIYQDAFCLTYGADNCDKAEITLIQDSILIPESLIKQFDDHPDITLLTFSTGNVNNKKTTLTFQLSGGKDPEFYELFKLQLESISNGVYIPEIHITVYGTYISIKTNNYELIDSNNSRLQQWISNTILVISATNDTTKNFISNTRENYNVLNSGFIELSTSITEMTEIVDSGVEDYTEQQQINNALQQLTEKAVSDKLQRIFESTAVRDIIEDTTDVEKSVLTVTTSPLSTTNNKSNFDTVNSNISKIIDTLLTSDPITVKNNITNELKNLKDLPQDILDSYTKDIFNSVDKFPFTSIDSIKNSISGYATQISSSYINQGNDFITDSKGQLLTAGDTIMTQFGVTAVKEAFNKFSNSGNITGMIKGLGSEYISSTLSQLPIDDVKSLMDDVKKFSNYVNIENSGDMIGQYTQKIMDAGITSSPINKIMSGIGSQISSLGSIVSQLESGSMSKLDAVKQMTDIGPTLQTQIDKINSYAKGLSSFFSNSTSFSDKFIKAKTDIQKIMDVTYLLKTPANAISQSAGCFGSAKCLLSYGLKSLG